MSDFQSWRSYADFARSVKSQARYVRTSSVEQFLSTVKETGQTRIQVLKQGSIVWRAQRGHNWEPIEVDGERVDEAAVPHPLSRMTPRPNLAVEGRANPKGIPYLYTSTNLETALGEVRPWVGSFVSVAEFKTTREMRIINCTTDRKKYRYYFQEPTSEKREEAVWLAIDAAFATPVTLNEEVADYVPTQIIAELFKSDGCDGLACRSSLGSGYNIVLFDLGSAELMNCRLFDVQRIHFEFKEASNPYFVLKHYKDIDDKGA